ncbi:transketolase [Sphaeroforma arctica JP610]|uniref:transketolase n=1 Tax=Sphaeroforma arctica JP610 TaxID=667725 RepID=A0A0L0FUS3_9EUKA|nr:transketolase [Sphaeroforma arctica JP610]KNC79683.1 transketolase [Sphaeroforma arctica JP610]|eukprot:XP_014153585.1 transketolase [Sphaeroforma arctica JP610]
MSKRPTRQSSSQTPKKAKNDMDKDQTCINAIRCLSADMPSAANSGHPGAPMGCAPLAYLLWTKFMSYDPQDPSWLNRDRFVLSNGHACALQYAMLHLTGYDLSMEDLKNFRQIGSKTPGHPERDDTPGIEVTTGPLGQGVANAVGLAMAEKHMAATFNTSDFPDLIDNTVYVIMGDGCHQEGVSSEACSLAGHLKLGNLIVLYDDNSITIDGDTSLSFTEDVPKRFESYGWETITVDGLDSDITDLEAAIEKAKLSKDKPTLISCKTTIGFGSGIQGTHGVHGAPLKPDDLKQVKEKFGFNGDDKFVVPSDALAVFREAGAKGAAAHAEWKGRFEQYKIAEPAKAVELARRLSGKLPEDWRKCLPTWTSEDPALASRQTSEKVLNAIAEALPELVGGSADLTPSNLTQLKCSSDFQHGSYEGRYFRFGVREHGMAAICNGLAAYGGLVPFGATFFNFIQYMLPSVRLSALSHLRVLYIMTHDSIGLGEDGPTHQPINALALCRSMPNCLAIRPCDGNETAGAYAVAMENGHRPSVLVFSRQGLPQQDGSTVDKVFKGAYTLVNCEKPKVILVASGSEVPLCVDAAKLVGEGARVVSMPCMDLFEEQSAEYKSTVFPEGVPVLAVEALSGFGWDRYSHAQHCMKTFGASGPLKKLFVHFGFTPENISDKANGLVKFYEGKPVPSLVNRFE